MLLVLIAKEEDETSKGILWVLHGGDDSLSARRAPDFLECGTRQNPCRCKVVGPTLGFVAFLVTGVIEWPVGAVVYIFKHSKGRRIMGHPATVELSPGKEARKLAVENALKKLNKGPDGRYTNVWEMMSDVDVLIGAFENIISGPEYEELRKSVPKRLNMQFFKYVQTRMRDSHLRLS
ncbi:hypothetical protein IGI04_041280 [Brassica rapa subsp. trilocularis]|uniref:Uncharacterized protein n=1 Tax=Brassica rapa subsp. trilocularis TaxID=1813537 RepID=A0ABQ7KR13_BRACM|nr:hypothetical protein IGI04_041280 [Brassica rapa subsp. trilocularis]